MRRLILFRHAKSGYPEGVADLDRPLDERGRAAAPRMGAYLAAEGLRPDHVMVSPARRTLETWQGLRSHLGIIPRSVPRFAEKNDAKSEDGIEAETVHSLYEAPASRILDALRSAPATAGSLLVIGHNPGLQDLALLLTGSGSAVASREMRLKFPTAALAVFDFPVEGWSGIGKDGGRLERFVTPRGLARDAAR